MPAKEACRAGGPIYYAVFFCTDEGFGSEMVQTLGKPHAVDIVQALQPGAVPEAVPATSLKGKDRPRLLPDWMDALAQSMASERGPAIPNLLALRPCSRGLRARSPGRLIPRSAIDCVSAAGPARAAVSRYQR
jgi:hypothetical protein